MEFVIIIIAFMLIIIFANILAKAIPVLPLPIIQIVLGILLGLTKLGESVHFEPELFMILVIAPLLFREGETTNVVELWRLKRPILILAFLLVFLTVFVLGGVLRWLVPAIPLAACFAVGASLGPTDAVAVTSLSNRIKIPEKIMHILEGEGLINDASGVTAFQFAVATLLTGYFSFINASWKFFYICFGGILVGILLVNIKNRVLVLLKKFTSPQVSTNLMLEILLPFSAFALAEILQMSGVLAAVVAGILQAINIKKINLFEAQLNSIVNTTWETIQFLLNSLVFLFLGLQLPSIVTAVWSSANYTHLQLILWVIVLTLLMIGLRFLCVTVFLRVRRNDEGGILDSLNNSLVLTFAGVKGTVSLATVFSIPVLLSNGETFTARSLLLFITAGVIILSLLLAVIILPFLTEPISDVNVVNQMEVNILNEVIEQLETVKKHRSNEGNYEAVIRNYQKRIDDCKKGESSRIGRNDEQQLRALIFSVEHAGLEEAYRKKLISTEGYRFYYEILHGSNRFINRSVWLRMRYFALGVMKGVNYFTHLKFLVPDKKEKHKLRNYIQEHPEIIDEIKSVFLNNTTVILKTLENLEGTFDSATLAKLIRERKTMTQQLEENRFIEAWLKLLQPDYIEELVYAYGLERDLILMYEKSEKLTLTEANEMRQQVNLLETYAMDDSANDLLTEWLKKIAH